MQRNNNRRPLFCERSFGIFFVLWGAILIISDLLGVTHVGEFYTNLRRYLPEWAWGVIISVIGAGRFIAFRLGSRRWRLNLSLATLLLLACMASLALWAGRYLGTFPLAAFAAYMAYWCHSAMLRDTRLGL